MSDANSRISDFSLVGLKTRNYAIHCLKDIHISEQNAKTKLWRQIFLSSVLSVARGIGVLFNEKLECRIIQYLWKKRQY